MSLHKEWIKSAVAAGLGRFAKAAITIKDAPPDGKTVKVDFDKVEFALDRDGVLKLFDLAEANRGTVKAEDGSETPGENAVNTLLTYAYGLNCRAKVRADYERQYVDPEKADKQMAEKLVKQGRFKSFDKALAAVKLLREDEDDE